MRIETAAKLACAYSGLVWGMFWIPLRALEARGIEGVWATLIFYAIPFVLVLPFAFWRWRLAFTSWRPVFLGFMSATGLVPYSLAVLDTEVIKAMLLFYLTPLWSTLIARVFLGEAITPLRWLALASGFLGMVVVLNSGHGIPWPSNSGDWMALASGFLWAVTANLFRADNGRTHPVELWVHNFIWSFAIAVVFIFLLGGAGKAMPPVSLYAQQLWWLVPTVIVMVMSGVFATTWGAPKLNPGIVGLLFMTEISVGAVTAALWAGEPFGWRETIGIVLITGAGIAESALDIWRGRQRAARV